MLCGVSLAGSTRPKCHPVTKAGLRAAWNRRLYAMTLALNRMICLLGGVLFNSAQLVRERFMYLGFRESRMAPAETSGESRYHDNRHEIIIAIMPTSGAGRGVQGRT